MINVHFSLAVRKTTKLRRRKPKKVVVRRGKKIVVKRRGFKRVKVKRTRRTRTGKSLIDISNCAVSPDFLAIVLV